MREGGEEKKISVFVLIYYFVKKASFQPPPFSSAFYENLVAEYFGNSNFWD